MSRTVITCDRLSKKYTLGGHPQNRLHGGPPNLREAVSRRIASARDALTGRRPAKPGEDHAFWALKDVSFEVGRGEVVGIVGRNGAGKSTLLKVLSRIVEPTAGSVRLRGRIASLLEVGTGFHAELTGRENIYMNGTILGMRKAEIDRKFDEIVAFSEIEEFLDTPVKRYSSGMYVRLAFAVAAHLEPEILIVDEVLAVGDYSFQKKCLGKMQDVASGDGRTILFVSHNVGTLAQLCQRGILLKGGSVAMNGPIRDVIAEFMQSMSDHRAAEARFAADDPSKPCQFLSAAIVRDDGSLGSEFGCDEPFTIRLELEIRRPVPGMKVFIDLYTIDGVRFLCSDARDSDPSIVERLGAGRHTFDVRVPGQVLGATTYLLNIATARRGSEPIDYHLSCCEFSLRDTVSAWPDRPGMLSLMLPWQHRRDDLPDRDGRTPAAPA